MTTYNRILKYSALSLLASITLGCSSQPKNKTFEDMFPEENLRKYRQIIKQESESAMGPNRQQVPSELKNHKNINNSPTGYNPMDKEYTFYEYGDHQGNQFVESLSEMHNNGKKRANTFANKLFYPILEFREVDVGKAHFNIPFLREIFPTLAGELNYDLDEARVTLIFSD